MILGRVLDMDRDYAIGALYGLVLLALVVLSPLLPAALERTGPLVCPDGQPDTFVTTAFAEPDEAVAARSSDGGISMFCMGERGDVTEVGLLRPVVALVGAAALGLLALTVLGVGLRRAARRLLGRR